MSSEIETTIDLEFEQKEEAILKIAISSGFHEELLSEIRYRINIDRETYNLEWREYGMDAANELDILNRSPKVWLYDIIEDIIEMLEFEKDFNPKGNRCWQKKIRTYLVKHGYYKEINPQSYVSTGSKDIFRLNNKFYAFDHEPGQKEELIQEI